MHVAQLRRALGRELLRLTKLLLPRHLRHVDGGGRGTDAGSCACGTWTHLRLSLQLLERLERLDVLGNFVTVGRRRADVRAGARERRAEGLNLGFEIGDERGVGVEVDARVVDDLLRGVRVPVTRGLEGVTRGREGVTRGSSGGCLRVERVSVSSSSAGEMFASIEARALPPRQSLSSHVSDESRYGTCGAFPVPRGGGGVGTWWWGDTWEGGVVRGGAGS